MDIWQLIVAITPMTRFEGDWDEASRRFLDIWRSNYTDDPIWRGLRLSKPPMRWVTLFHQWPDFKGIETCFFKRFYNESSLHRWPDLKWGRASRRLRKRTASLSCPSESYEYMWALNSRNLVANIRIAGLPWSKRSWEKRSEFAVMLCQKIFR